IPIGDAYGLWRALETKYESKTLSNKLSVRRQLQECTMEDHEHVDTYLARFMQLVLQLQDMGVALAEDEKISMFMMGLPSTLGPFMDALEISQTKLTFDSICEFIRNHQEKSLIKARREAEVANSAYDRKYKSQQKSNSNQQQQGKNSDNAHGRSTALVKCFNCGGVGHVKSGCGSEQIGDGFTYSNRNKSDTPAAKNGSSSTSRSGTAMQSSSVDAKRGDICDADDFSMGALAMMASEVPSSRSHSKHESDWRHSLAGGDSDILAEGTDDHINSVNESASGEAFEEVAYGALSSQNASDDTVEFMLDSAASRTNVVDKQLLTDVRTASSPISIKVASKEVISVDQVGKSNLVVSHASGKQVVPLSDVVYAPSFAANLLSVGNIVEKGCGVLFTNHGAMIVKLQGSNVCTVSFSANGKPTVTSGGETIMTVPKVGKLFIWSQKRSDMMKVNTMKDLQYKKGDQSYLSSEEQMSAFNLWHRRLGHVGSTELKKLIDSKGVVGLELLRGVNMDTIREVKKNKFCESCVMGKSHREPFVGHLHQPAKDIMDRWHGDLQGPIRVEKNQEAVATAGGNLYWFNIIDEKSHKRLSRAIALKSSAADALIDMIKRAQVLTGKTLKEFHSDDGGEFRSDKLQRFLRDNGTKQTVTQRATPQHNPIAERDGRTVMNMVVSMLHQSGLPPQFWAAAASTAVYILNRTVNTSNLHATPEELFSGYKPSVKAVRVFGCDGYVNLQKDQHPKVGPKAIRAIYIGPDEDRKG